MKALGSRCPDCKTTDAPQVMHYLESEGKTLKWAPGYACPRCGRARRGVDHIEALAAFYGPQPEREGPTPCPVCGKEPELRKSVDGQVCFRCESYAYTNSYWHGLGVKYFPTEAEALAAWEELVGGGR